MNRESRAALYARESTADGTVGQELDKLRARARQFGNEWVEYLEAQPGNSPAKLPERARMMEAAGAGWLDVVVVWKLSSLGDSLADLLDILVALDGWGVQLLSLRDELTSIGPERSPLSSTIRAIIEFDRDMICERVAEDVTTACGGNAGRFGRPRCVINLALAKQLLRKGESLGAAAKRLGVSPRTLRRRLQEYAQAGPPPPASAPSTGRRGGGQGRRQ